MPLGQVLAIVSLVTDGNRFLNLGLMCLSFSGNVTYALMGMVLNLRAGQRYSRLKSIILVIISLCVSASASDHTWPQWRGPTRDGKVNGTRWPSRLDDGVLSRNWRVELGEGYPGPVVAADRVFVAETFDKKYERLCALDRKSGEVIWKTQWEGSMKVPFFAKKNGSWIRSTPAYDGQRVYVAGMRDVLVALDARTGAVEWKIDFIQKYDLPLPGFGLVCSPLVVGDSIYIQAGGAFTRIDKASGIVQWRTLIDGNGMYGGSFSSPTVATFYGYEMLLVQTRKEITGVKPADGSVLWRHRVPSFRGMNILTPNVYKNSVFTSTFKNRSFLFSVEQSAQNYSVRKSWDCAIRGYMSSPIVIGQHIYMHLENNRLVCLDLETGEPRWHSRKKFGEYASLVASKNQILMLTCEGELILFAAKPGAFELLDRRLISSSPTWGHLAVAGNQLFIRELNAVSAWQWLEPVLTQ